MAFTTGESVGIALGVIAGVVVLAFLLRWIRRRFWVGGSETSDAVSSSVPADSQTNTRPAERRASGVVPYAQTLPDWDGRDQYGRDTDDPNHDPAPPQTGFVQRLFGTGARRAQTSAAATAKTAARVQRAEDGARKAVMNMAGIKNAAELRGEKLANLRQETEKLEKDARDFANAARELREKKEAEPEKRPRWSFW